MGVGVGGGVREPDREVIITGGKCVFSRASGSRCAEYAGSRRRSFIRKERKREGEKGTFSRAAKGDRHPDALDT